MASLGAKQLDMQDHYILLLRTMITPSVSVKVGVVIADCDRWIVIFEEDHDAEVGHGVFSFSCKDSRLENQIQLVELDLILEYEAIIFGPFPWACLYSNYSYAVGCHQ